MSDPEAPSVEEIVVIGRRRRRGLFGWFKENIIDPIDENIVQPVARFVDRNVVQPVRRFVNEDIPAAARAVDRNVIQPVRTFVTRDVPVIAETAATAVNENVIAPVTDAASTALTATDDFLSATMANPYTRQMMMTMPGMAGVYLIGTEDGRNTIRATGYGILHDALGQGLPALVGGVIDAGVGIEETKLDIYSGLYRATFGGESLGDAFGNVRAPWHRLTGNANESYMRTFEHWGDENLAEWLTWPVGLADVEYRRSQAQGASMFDLEVSTDNELTWRPASRTETGGVIVGNILDPTNLIGIGWANKARLGIRAGAEIIEHGDDIIRIVETGTRELGEHGDDAARVGAQTTEEVTETGGRASTEVAEEGARPPASPPAAPPVEAPAPRPREPAAPRAADEAAGAGDDVADVADDVADIADDVPAPRSTFDRVTAPVVAVGRGTLGILGGIVRDPYTMTELSIYAVALGGSAIRENYFPRAAIGDVYSILQDPNSLDTPAGEQRLIDALNLVYARNSMEADRGDVATLVDGETQITRARPYRWAALDRDGGIMADTGAIAGGSDNALTRARFLAVETFRKEEGQASEVSLASNRQEYDIQIAFTGLVQRQLANPNAPFTRSEAVLVQMMLAREGYGEASADPAAARRALGEFISENELTMASVEARRNQLISDRNALDRDRADAPAYYVRPPEPAVATP